MKVAPEMFDYGVRDKLEREHADREEHMRQWQPLLRKVYGDEETDKTAPPEYKSWCRKGAERVQNPWEFLSPARRRRVQELYPEWRFWIDTANDCMARRKQQLGRKLPSFSAICSMIEVSFTFRRIAAGLETNLKESPQDTGSASNWEADLKRAYGTCAQQQHALFTE